VLNFTVLSAKKEDTWTEAVTDISAEHITIRSEQTLAEMLRGIQDKAAGRKLKGMPADHAHGKHGKHAHGKHAAPKGDVHHVPSYVAASSSSSSAAAAAASSSNGHGGGGDGGGGGSALTPDDGSRTRVYELALDRGISFDAACEILQTIVPEQESAFTSFYIGTHPITNTTMPLLAIKRPNSNYQFQICRPNSGRATVEMSKDMLLRNYHRVSAQEIRKPWSDLYELTLTHCTHGPKCKMGWHCEHGRRIRHINILGGQAHAHAHH